MYIHDRYLYVLADPVPEAPKVINVGTSEEPAVVPNHRFKSPGLYVYDASQLMEGKIESYKLSSAVVGASTLLDNSRFSDRFSFLSNFNEILVIPFPHMNLLNFVGMGQKQEYLIWRQTDGFFTALDKRGNILTWSVVTGRLLYTD